MTILHSGSNQKYSENWEAAFGGKRKSRTNGAVKKSKPSRSRAKARTSSKKARRGAKKPR
jgi:hypothetical protein